MTEYLTRSKENIKNKYLTHSKANAKRLNIWHIVKQINTKRMIQNKNLSNLDTCNFKSIEHTVQENDSLSFKKIHFKIMNQLYN